MIIADCRVPRLTECACSLGWGLFLCYTWRYILLGHLLCHKLRQVLVALQDLRRLLQDLLASIEGEKADEMRGEAAARGRQRQGR